MNTIDAPCFQDEPLPSRFHLGNRNEDVEKFRTSVEALEREFAPPAIARSLPAIPCGESTCIDPVCEAAGHCMDESRRNRLNEIATLVRALTYGEMIELAQGLFKAKGEGEITGETLAGVLHRWSGNRQ